MIKVGSCRGWIYLGWELSRAEAWWKGDPITEARRYRRRSRGRNGCGTGEVSLVRGHPAEEGRNL